MTDPEHDDVFEAYLKRRPVLPALDGKLEPPAALDQKVLAKAREAIGPQRVTGQHVTTEPGAPAGAAGARTNRAPRWAVPIALAATVLLCLSVVMNISLNTNHPSPNLERMVAARADLKASAKANAMAESNAAAGIGERGTTHAPNDGLAASTDQRRRESLPGDVPSNGGVPSNGEVSSNGEVPSNGEFSSNEVILPGAKVAGVAAPRAPVEAESADASEQSAAPASQLAAASQSAALAAHSAAAAARSAGGEGTASARVADAAPPPPAARLDTAPAAPTVSAEAAPSAPVRASAADKAVLFAKRAGVSTAAHPTAVVPGTARPTAADPAAVVPDAGRAGATNPVAAVHGTAHPANPKVWLQQIAALRAAGKAEQAAAEMRRFEVAFPGYAVTPAAPAPPAAPQGLPK